jgi:Protein of unknown function (DUF3185)
MCIAVSLLQEIFANGNRFFGFALVPKHQEVTMSPQRILGIILLIAGIVFFVMGMDARHSLADQTSNAFTGKFTDETTWYLIGGGMAILLGLLMTLFGVRGKDA